MICERASSRAAWRLSSLSVFLLLLGIGCRLSDPRGAAPSDGTSQVYEEAEALFHREPRWLGADAALSIPLGDDRILWLFGDTFIATSDALRRSESTMVRNSVAIQTGEDPKSAAISFHWRGGSDGEPASFFPESGELWYWPGHGIRLREGPLVIFLYTLRAAPGEGLGFAHAGHALAVIDDPDAPANRWRPRIIDAEPSAFDAVPATAVLREREHVVAVAIRQEGVHAGALVRYPASSLARGSLDQEEWWAGDARGWVDEDELGDEGPTFVLDDAGAECSLHLDKQMGSYLHVATYGFGASKIGLRTSPSITGPWNPPVTVYRPPESNGPSPFVYAAKAHPELVGREVGDLVVTYATNSFEFGDLFTEEGARSLYWPRCVLIPVRGEPNWRGSGFGSHGRQRR